MSIGQWISGNMKGVVGSVQTGVVVFLALICSGMLVVSLLLWAVGGQGAPALLSFVLFLAAALVGGLAGFLFGMPRARYTDWEALKDAAEPDRRKLGGYLINANLIKVSDWLTTIVVGITLVNLGKIPQLVADLQSNLQGPMGGQDYSGVLGVSVMVIGAAAGFLLSFLWTSVTVHHIYEQQQAEEEARNSGPTITGFFWSAGKKTLEVSGAQLHRPRVSDDQTVEVEGAKVTGSPSWHSDERLDVPLEKEPQPGAKVTVKLHSGETVQSTYQR